MPALPEPETLRLPLGIVSTPPAIRLILPPFPPELGIVRLLPVKLMAPGAVRLTLGAVMTTPFAEFMLPEERATKLPLAVMLALIAMLPPPLDEMLVCPLELRAAM